MTGQSPEMGVVERVARALYERNPQYDQEVDADYRPTTAPYRVAWDDLSDGAREDILEDARAAIEVSGLHELFSVVSDLFENPAYHVSLGGYPNFVGELIARARTALAKARGEQ